MDRVTMFISSTVKDLGEERNAVEGIIKNLGGECWRSETFISPGRSPYAMCVEMAKRCDIYVGIYGRRYGHVDEETKKSVTELEYEIAHQTRSGKVLIYVKAMARRDKLQMEFVRKVNHFRRGYFQHNQFTSTKELKQQFKADALAWIAERVKTASQLEAENAVLKAQVRTKKEFFETVMREHALPYTW